MGSLEMECSMDLCVIAMEPVTVPPNSKSSAHTILYLSNIDDQPILRTPFNTLLIYSARTDNSMDPAKRIREALPKVLDEYYPLAGRIRDAGNGKLEVECSGDGAVFVEATTHLPLSSLGQLDVLIPSLQQLLFQLPPAAHLHDIRPLVMQVTRFGCGGFVVGASFFHCLCDGRGAVQFLKGLAEICRGHVSVSVKPKWRREVLRPRNPPRVEFGHVEIIHGSAGGLPFWELEELPGLQQESFTFSSDTLKMIKQRILEQSTTLYTTFEILAALAWRARTKALQILPTETVKLQFAVDVRRSLKSSLPEGYYGNAFMGACALATARELLDGSLIRAIKMIRRAKLELLNEVYLRSAIDFLEMNRSQQHMTLRISAETLFISDWTRLGFDEVDFGWGDPTNVCPVTWKGFAHANVFLFIRPPKCKEGVRMLACLPWPAMLAFQSEMQKLSQGFIEEYNISNGDTITV